MHLSDLNFPNPIDGVIKAGAARRTSNGSGSNQAAETDKWQDTKELPSVLSAPPPLPEILIPPAFKDWWEDAAARLGVPVECIAVGSLCSIAILVGRRVAVLPKRFDTDWTVMLSGLWAALVAPPGQKKTPALRAGMKFLKNTEKHYRHEYRKRMKVNDTVIKVLSLKIKGIEKMITQLIKKGDDTANAEAELSRLQKEFKTLLLEPRRFTTQDATIEKLSELLSANPAGIGVTVDELMSFIRGMERPGHERDRSFYLTAWNGTESEAVDRIGRGSIFNDALYVVVLGGIQPDVLKEYIKENMANNSAADGLLARIQLCIVPNLNEPRPIIDCAPNIVAHDKAEAVYSWFVKLSEVSWDDRDEFRQYKLKFSDDAQELFNAFLFDLEEKLAKCDMTPALEAHLSKQRSTMPALAAIFHLVGWAASDNPGRIALPGESPIGAITLEAAKLAAAWCEWLEEHAKFIYRSAIDQSIAAAHALGERIKAGDVANQSTVREIYRHGWRHLSSKKAVQAAIEILEDHCWLKVRFTLPISGRPAQIVEFHPDILQGEVTK